MAETLTTGKVKLPTDVAAAIMTDVQDASVLAKLAASTPQLFRNKENLIFHPTAEAEVVGEGGAKSAYTAQLTSVPATIVKVQTMTRVTNELEWADRDNRLAIIQNIQADQSKAVARSVDYVGIHAINPLTGAALTGTYPHLTQSTVTVTAAAGDDGPVADLDALTDALIDKDVDGLALSPAYAAALRKVRVASTGQRLYPEVPLSVRDTGSIDGIRAAVSGTVNGRRASEATGVLGIMGDFSMFKWGMVRDMWADIIRYGSPDGGDDLQHSNEVVYRTEAVFAYAILDLDAFAVLKAATGKAKAAR